MYSLIFVKLGSNLYRYTHQIFPGPFFGWLNLSQTLSLLNPDLTDHPGLTYLNWFETYWGLVSELSLIWAWSKLQRRSKQGFWPYPNQDQDSKPQSGTSSILKSPKSDVRCTFRIKMDSRNWKHECKRDQWPYPNQDQDSKLRSGIGTSSILQSPNLFLIMVGINLSHIWKEEPNPNARA